MFMEGANDYILRLREQLANDFTIVNQETSMGLVDILLKLHKTNVLYFNWVEDIPDRKLGYLQVLLLLLILVIAKLSRIHVVWFIHNNLSHYRKNKVGKRLVRKMMEAFADDVFSHSEEVYERKAGRLTNLQVKDHPIPDFKALSISQPIQYDVVVWGSVNSYKGVIDFLRYLNATSHNLKILIAGRFCSAELYEQARELSGHTITLVNKVLSKSELEHYLSISRYVLFTYNSPSVLSSAALCKTLGYGKTVFGPRIGAFKELGERNLICNYEDFADLINKIEKCKQQAYAVSIERLHEYADSNNWESFRTFVVEKINQHSIYPALATTAGS